MRTRMIWLVAGLMAGGASAMPPVTYQGTLEDAGLPADGLYDIGFEVYGGRTGGTLLTKETFNDHEVVGGLFSVELDSLDGVVGDRSELWIEIEVRDGASTGPYTTLLPRQRLTASPEALFAHRAATADVVTSIETIDEPGVASFLAEDAGDGDLFSSYSVLAQQTITCPADGYVLAIGLVMLDSLAFANSGSSAEVALSLDGSAPYLGRSWEHSIGSGVGSTVVGTTSPGIAMHLIPVAAGPTTVSLIAKSSDGDDYADSPSLVLVYLPTAYGPVEAEIEGRIASGAVPGANGEHRAPARSGPESNDVADLRARVEILETLMRRQQHQIETLRTQLQHTASLP